MALRSVPWTWTQDWDQGLRDHKARSGMSRPDGPNNNLIATYDRRCTLTWKDSQQGGLPHFSGHINSICLQRRSWFVLSLWSTGISTVPPQVLRRMSISAINTSILRSVIFRCSISLANQSIISHISHFSNHGSTILPAMHLPSWCREAGGFSSG